MHQSMRAAVESIAASVDRWLLRQRFLSVRLRFYQDYLDSRMLLRSFARARAAQLKKRGDAAYKPVSEIARLLREGHTVAESLKPVAPPADVALIQAFEQSNRLQDGFTQVVRKVRDETQLKKEVLEALTKPVIYLGLGLAMLTVGIPSMVDSIGPLIDKATQTLDQRALLAFSGFMERFAGLIIPGIVVLLVGAIASLPFWAGSLRRRVDAISPLHRMYRAYHGASFLKVLAIQLSVTPQLDRALATIASNSNPWLRSYLVEIMRALPHNRIHPMDAFDVGLLDASVLDSLTLISRSGTAEEAIALRAEQSTAKAIESIRRTAAALQQAAIGLAGALLIWVATSLVLNLVKTNLDKVQQSQTSGVRTR